MRIARLLAVALLVVLFPAVPVRCPPTREVWAAQTKAGMNEVKVWVNTSSGVYHCPGTRWYGATKRGKYMGECAAIKDGNRPAYGRACGSDCQAGPKGAPPTSPSANENTASTKTEQAGNPDVKVWVNTGSGVYHCPGTRWYGNTKQGEYMTQKKAQDGGYRPAYGKVCQ